MTDFKDRTEDTLEVENNDKLVQIMEKIPNHVRFTMVCNQVFPVVEYPIIKQSNNTNDDTKNKSYAASQNIRTLCVKPSWRDNYSKLSQNQRNFFLYVYALYFYWKDQDLVSKRQKHKYCDVFCKCQFLKGPYRNKYIMTKIALKDHIERIKGRNMMYTRGSVCV